MSEDFLNSRKRYGHFARSQSCASRRITAPRGSSKCRATRRTGMDGDISCICTYNIYTYTYTYIYIYILILWCVYIYIYLYTPYGPSYVQWPYGPPLGISNLPWRFWPGSPPPLGLHTQRRFRLAARKFLKSPPWCLWHLFKGHLL